MALSFDEVRDILIKKLDSGERLKLHELEELANDSDDFNFIRLNDLYATLLKNYPEVPSSEQIAQELMYQIKLSKFGVGDSLVLQSIVYPITAKYELLTPDILEEAFELLTSKGYIKETKNNTGEQITVLTQAGFDAL